MRRLHNLANEEANNFFLTSFKIFLSLFCCRISKYFIDDSLKLSKIIFLDYIEFFCNCSSVTFTHFWIE